MIRPVLLAALSILTLLSPSAWAASDHETYMCSDIFKPFFTVAETYPDGRKLLASNRSESLPSRFLTPKPAGILRVFVAGESVAAIFSDSLKKPLEAILPSRNIEVINTGMKAYNSERIAIVLEEALGDEPDLVVVFSGHNDAYTGDACLGFFDKLNLRFQAWPAYRSLQEMLQDKKGEAARDIRSERLTRHEANLRQMVRSAKSKKVPIALCTLPSNIRDYAPYGAAPLGDPRFFEAWSAMERGDRPAALRLFRTYAEASPREPFGHFFLARCLELSGRIPEARRHYKEALEWDERGDRSTPLRNENVRKICKEEGAILADLGKAFDETAPGGLIGDSMMRDGVHWYNRYNPLVAYTILRALRNDKASPFKTPASRSGWDWAALETMKRSALHPRPGPEEEKREADELLLYSLREIDLWSLFNDDGRISERGIAFLEQLDERAGQLLLEASQSKESVRKMLKKSFWAPDLEENLARWWPVFLEHLGETYRRRGKAKDGIPLLEEALRLAPERFLIQLQRALAYQSAGRPKDASADFEMLAPRSSRYPEIALFANQLKLPAATKP